MLYQFMKIDINSKTGRYGDKVYSFCNRNDPKDCVECASFTILSIDSLLVHENKYFLQVYLGNYAD